jgi:peroxiredoxin
MTLSPGDQAPPFTLESVTGESYSLEEPLQAGSHLLLVFFRHLG